jgi:hypothetical protein
MRFRLAALAVALFVLLFVLLALSVPAAAAELPSCTFDAPPATATNAATLARSIREGRKGPVTLKNVVVDGDLLLDDLELSGGLQIEDVTVLGRLSLKNLRAVKLTILRSRIRDGLVLDDVRVERGVEIEESGLCGGVAGSRTSVGADFAIRESRICNDTPFKYDEHMLEWSGPMLAFSRGQVGGDLRLEHVKETCPLSLRSFRVGARIMLHGVELVPIKDTTVLEVLAGETQGGLFLTDTTVGKVKIIGLKGGFHALQKTEFREEVKLAGVSAGNLLFAGAETKSVVQIVDSDLEAVDIVQSGFHGPLVMMGTKTGGVLNFGSDKFWSRMRLIGISAGSFVTMTESEFFCEKDCTCESGSEDCPRNDLVSVEAKAGVSFWKATFHRSTSIANIHDVSLINLSDCVLDAPFTVNAAHLAGPLALDSSEVRGRFSLIDVQASQLAFESVKWGTPRDKVRLVGVRFKRLDLGPEADPSFSRVFDLLDHVDYSRDLYESAAQYVQQEGRADIARELRLVSERRDLAGGRAAAGGTLRYVWKAFLFVAIGGGVAPERVFILLVALLLFGALLFRDKGVMVWRGRAEEPAYSSFWYTLDLLLPVMKLEDARDWSPRPPERFRIYTARIMRVVGFLMVPLLLAAATGLVR